MSLFKPLIIVALLLVFLRVTGLMSFVSSAGNWVILQSGLRDASDGKDAAEEEFNFNFTIQD
ncbi:MAG TPA: hypothetical protein VG737_17125, partial [Cyclobacteriaceae bacterium]|nr:hypothetical protein [Cyclobacteriaceae bacterium]